VEGAADAAPCALVVELLGGPGQEVLGSDGNDGFEVSIVPGNLTQIKPDELPAGDRVVGNPACSSEAVAVKRLMSSTMLQSTERAVCCRREVLLAKNGDKRRAKRSADLGKRIRVAAASDGLVRYLIRRKQSRVVPTVMKGCAITDATRRV